MPSGGKATRAPRDWATAEMLNPLGEALRAELLGWPGLELRPMMGTLAFFRGRVMLGCYVHRGWFKKTPPKWAPGPEEPPFLWIRLTAAARVRALRSPLVKESGTAAVKRWVQVALESRVALETAVRWLGEAYEDAPAVGRVRAARRRRRKARRRISVR